MFQLFRRVMLWCVVPAAVLAAFGAVAAPLDFEDLWGMVRVGAPAVSPDGQWVAFPASRYSVEDNRGVTDLYLVPSDGSLPPRRITWSEENDTSPAWSPDGSRLTFVSRRGEGPAQLYVLPMSGGEAEPVTRLPVAVQDPRWFPDGTRIGFVAMTFPDLNDDFAAVKARLEAQRANPVQVKASDTRLVRFWDRYITDGMVPHIFAVDLETRQVTDLLPGSERFFGLMSPGGGWDISPDGKEIAFSANATEPPYRDLNYDVFLVPSAGGEPLSITAHNPAADSRPRYSPDGRFLVYGEKRRVEWAPEFTHLIRYDRETGQRTELLPGWDGDPESWTFAPDGATVLFLAEEHGRRHIWRIPITGGAPEVVLRGGTLSAPAAGPDGLVVSTRESLAAPAELEAAQLGGGEPRRLTDFNGERLAEITMGRVEDVWFEGAGGARVQMFVLYPPDFDPEKKWPLLQLVHGGPHGAWLDSFHYRWNGAMFAARGYVTALVNFHGSPGFGQAFAESILGAHGDLPYRDIMKSTDHLLQRGYIDESRMALAGASYGGYLVAWITAQTDRFACAVNHAGVYDLMAQFASDMTWTRSISYGAEPWVDPARIDRFSPSRFAAGFSTPTLHIYGERDFRVPVTQGLNFHGVLQLMGVPSRMVIFPDEGHWIAKPRNARVWWNEVLDWLDRHLSPAETPETGT